MQSPTAKAGRRRTTGGTSACREIPALRCAKSWTSCEGSAALTGPGASGCARGLHERMKMNYRMLGGTGLRVSEISLGSWTTYGGSVAAGDAAPLARRAFELGINLFDTADVYVRGAAESALGDALQGIPREQVVVATKVMGRVWDGQLGAGLSRKHIFDAMDQSLRLLKLDYVDLYQLHAPDPNAPIEETLRALEDLVRAGKARYVGFSNYDPQPELLARAVAIQKARGFDRFMSSQPRYTLLEPRIEREHMPFCVRN